MKLYIELNDELHEVDIDDLDEFDLSKPMARNVIMNAIKNAADRLKLGASI